MERVTNNKIIARIAAAVFIISFTQLILQFAENVTDGEDVLLSYDMQWRVWDLTRLSCEWLVTVALFVLVPWKETRLKAITAMLVMLSTFSSLSYLAMIAFEETPYWYWPVYIGAMLILVFGSPLVLFLITRAYDESSELLTRKGAFLCYKYPLSPLGILGAIIRFPYGHCVVVLDGYEYGYKKGMLKKTKHTPKAFYRYVKTVSVTKDQMKQMLGTRFSYRNNCFTVLERMAQGEESCEIKRL